MRQRRSDLPPLGFQRARKSDQVRSAPHPVQSGPTLHILGPTPPNSLPTASYRAAIHLAEWVRAGTVSIHAFLGAWYASTRASSTDIPVASQVPANNPSFGAITGGLSLSNECSAPPCSSRLDAIRNVRAGTPDSLGAAVVLSASSSPDASDILPALRGGLPHFLSTSCIVITSLFLFENRTEKLEIGMLLVSRGGDLIMRPAQG